MDDSHENALLEENPEIVNMVDSVEEGEGAAEAQACEEEKYQPSNGGVDSDTPPRMNSRRRVQQIDSDDVEEEGEERGEGVGGRKEDGGNEDSDR